MRIQIVCPARAGTLYGNRITAERWQRILRQLGQRAAISTGYEGAACDVLVALHAKRSAGAVFEFHERYPDRAIVVALTGTDLYRDIQRYKSAQRALELATRIVGLQPLACAELAPALRPRFRVIYQCVERTRGSPRRPTHSFRVCVVGHLRDVKDPFRAAMAARNLPAASRVEIVHAGAAMTEPMAARARAEERRNPRYRWLGEIPRGRVRRLIASSQLLVLSSRMEGGANVISEALVDGTPVVSSRIPGSIGLLGEKYPGLYDYGDTAELEELLLRAETDRRFYSELRRHCARLAPLFRPSRELAAWRRLVCEIEARH